MEILDQCTHKARFRENGFLVDSLNVTVLYAGQSRFKVLMVIN